MATKFVLKSNNSNGRHANESAREYVFDGALFTLGSDATNNLILADGAGEQAVVVREGDSMTLINSADGTRLNGANLPREAIQPLGAGDEIAVGNHTILVVEEEDDDAIENDRAQSENGEPQTDKNSPFATNGKRMTPRAEREAPPQNKIAVQSSEKKSANNFAAVLDTLRTEEDSFYFVVKKREVETARVALEQAEIPIGASDKNEIVFDIKQMTTVFGVVRKDWSGIILEANRSGAMLVGGEAIGAGAPRRLRNDDRVSFAAPVEAVMILHEPSLLVALEPLLSARATANNGANDNAALVNQKNAPQKKKPKAPLLERTFFNYFSFVEMLSMVIATLIGAVLFFLLFELMFS